MKYLKTPSELKIHLKNTRKELKKLNLKFCYHSSSDFTDRPRKKSKDLHYDNISEKQIYRTPCVFICLAKLKNKKTCRKFPTRLIGCSY